MPNPFGDTMSTRLALRSVGFGFQLLGLLCLCKAIPPWLHWKRPWKERADVPPPPFPWRLWRRLSPSGTSADPPIHPRLWFLAGTFFFAGVVLEFLSVLWE